MLACVQTSPLPQKKSGEMTATKMPSFSIASCSNGVEIHSMELLHFREKRTGLAKKLGLYNTEDKHILQETGRGEGGNTDI